MRIGSGSMLDKVRIAHLASDVLDAGVGQQIAGTSPVGGRVLADEDPRRQAAARNGRLGIS